MTIPSTKPRRKPNERSRPPITVPLKNNFFVTTCITFKAIYTAEKIKIKATIAGTTGAGIKEATKGVRLSKNKTAKITARPNAALPKNSATKPFTATSIENRAIITKKNISIKATDINVPPIHEIIYVQ